MPKFKYTYEEVVEKFKEKNYNVITLKEDYKGTTKTIETICPNGCKYVTTLHNFLQGYGCSCENSSKGELAIKEWLDNRNIKHVCQCTFDDCKWINLLRFDFYIPDNNLLIEYDGIQHFKIIDHFGGFDGFVSLKIRDTYKNVYCKNKDIKLLRISYKDYENINKILENSIKYNEASTTREESRRI